MVTEMRTLFTLGAQGDLVELLEMFCILKWVMVMQA